MRSIKSQSRKKKTTTTQSLSLPSSPAPTEIVPTMWKCRKRTLARAPIRSVSSFGLASCRASCPGRHHVKCHKQIFLLPHCRWCSGFECAFKLFKWWVARNELERVCAWDSGISFGQSSENECVAGRHDTERNRTNNATKSQNKWTNE